MPFLSTTTGPILPLLAVAALFWLCLAIGNRVFDLLGLDNVVHEGERLLISVALGVGVLPLVPFVLGAFGWLTVRSLQLTIGAIAVLAASDLMRVGARLDRAIRTIRPEPWQLAWTLALLPALSVALLLALVPTVDPDGLGYHLTIPKRWVQSGWLAYLPTYTNSNAPMGAEMLYTIAMVFVGDAGAKLTHWALGVLGAVGLVLAGRRLGTISGGFATAAVYIVGPISVASLLGRAYIEGAVAFVLTSSVLAWLVWVQNRNPRWLQCAGLLAGVAVSFKMTAALFPLVLLGLTAAVILGLSNEQRRAALGTGPQALWLLGLSAVPATPWLLRSMLLTGNPFFPLFARFLPTRDLPPESAAALDRYFRYWNWGTSLGPDWTMERRRLVLLGAAVSVVLVAIVISRVLQSVPARRMLWVLAAGVVLQISAVGIYGRYWSMLLPLLVLPVVAAVGEWLSRRWVRYGLIAVTVGLSLVQVQRSLRDVGGDARGLVATALGFEDRHAFVTKHLPLFPIFDYANGTLSKDTRILLVYSCTGFYFDALTFCDESFESSLRWSSWEEFKVDIQRLRVTHVMAPVVLASHEGAPPVARIRSMVNEDNVNELIRRLLGRDRQPLVNAADQGLFAVESAQPQGH